MFVCFPKSHGKPRKDFNKVRVPVPPGALSLFHFPGAETRLSWVTHSPDPTAFPGDYCRSLSGFFTPRAQLAPGTCSELMVMMVETLGLRPPG